MRTYKEQTELIILKVSQHNKTYRKQMRLIYSISTAAACLLMMSVIANPQVKTAIGRIFSFNQLATTVDSFKMTTDTPVTPIIVETPLPPQVENQFALLTYAVEAQKDGSYALREVEIVDQPVAWKGYYDGEKGLLYVNVGLKCEDENIVDVELFVEEGFFAMQHVEDLQNNDTRKFYVGEERRLAVVGSGFSNLGKSIVLDKENMTDDVLIFWGTKVEMSEHFGALYPQSIDIFARATLHDGTTDERMVRIDLSRMGELKVNLREADINRYNLEFDYYMSIPLGELELIPESVNHLTTPYANIGNNELYYEYDIGFGYQDTLVNKEFIEFDKNGYYRSSTGEDRDGNTYIVVINCDSNGEMTGMINRVPEHLRYAHIRPCEITQ